MLANLLGVFPHVVDNLGRSGGGGSSSGGGGGESIIVLLGYLPMHYVGRWLRKHGDKNVASIAEQLIGWVIALVYAIFWIIIWGGIGFLIGVGALVGVGAGLYNWFSKIKQSSLVQGKLKVAAENDSAWNEETLLARASDVFQQYQRDWSAQNTEAMKAYMTPGYQYHAALLVYALKLSGRQNIVENPQISESLIAAVDDALDDAQDAVTVGITARATDRLIDKRDDKQLFTDTSEFTEFWRFRRQGTTWLLDGIQQATAAAWVHNPSLEQFAAQNGYCYSADMGWLLIPARGQLFGSAKFGKSDINNHVIGLYNQQLLVQIYTYKPSPENSKSFLIAQVNVPKSYGSIVVRRKKALQIFGISGLEKVSTEWQQFNDKYEVFASSTEQATSFELLNPRYMEQLEAAPFEVNIEVVDNVVYFYSDERNASATDYQAMLHLLQLAFNEMKL